MLFSNIWPADTFLRSRRLISKLQHCNSSPTCTLYLFIVVDWSKVDILLEVQILLYCKKSAIEMGFALKGSGRPTHPLHSATKDSVGLTVWPVRRSLEKKAWLPAVSMSSGSLALCGWPLASAGAHLFNSLRCTWSDNGRAAVKSRLGQWTCVIVRNRIVKTKINVDNNTSVFIISDFCHGSQFASLGALQKWRGGGG